MRKLFYRFLLIKRIFIKYGNTIHEPSPFPFHDSETTLRSILSNPLKSTSSYTSIYPLAHSGYTPFRQKGSSAKFKKKKKRRKKIKEKMKRKP